MGAYADSAAEGTFGRSRVLFEQMVTELSGSDAGGLEHAVLEERLSVAGLELMRALLQDHLDLRRVREKRIPGGVAGPDGRVRSRAEAGRSRQLVSVFGPVTVTRIAYRAPGETNVCPADEVLNLPEGQSYSHGIQRLAVVEAARGSFAQAAEAIERCTGVVIGTRQIRDLSTRAAQDAEAFYATRPASDADPDDILVLTFDGKGIVMRPHALRPATARAAARAAPRLGTRLSPGEKTGRKRMAELACVHDLTPDPRTPADVLPTRTKTPPTSSDPGDPGRSPTPAKRPRATGRWLTASLERDIPSMIAAGFAEADRRDPAYQRTWVALVDGNQDQITAIKAEADARGITVPIIIDVIHVLEYVWSAAWSFFDKGEPAAEEWVTSTFQKILESNALHIAAGIRRRATRFGYTATKRKNADTTATYLTNHATHLDYHTALAQGWPIATGVIEGACRHLIKDRMDITGARWASPVAEAILTLRAIHTTGDLPDYWAYHLAQEHHRTYHEAPKKPCS